MGKKVKNPVNKNRKSGNSRRRLRRPINNLSVRPPPIPFHRMMMNIVLRIVISADTPINGSISGKISVADILSSPWSHLKEAFTQIKVKRVDVRAIPDIGMDVRGAHGLNVSPLGEFSGGKASLAVIECLPGTSVGKVIQPLVRSWYPTSPNERMYLNTAGSSTLFEYFHKAEGMTSNGTANPTYRLDLVFDAHCLLRGVRLAQTLLTHDDASGLGYEMLVGH